MGGAFTSKLPAAAPAAPSAGGRRIKVLIVDDSAIVRNLLTKAMSDEADIIAKSGSQAEFRSDKIGAVDVIDKESLNLYNGLDTVKKVLIPKIRNAARTTVHKKSKEEVPSI